MSGHVLRIDDPRLGVIKGLGYEPVAILNTQQMRQVYRVRQGDSDYVVKFWQASGGRRPPYPVKSHRLLALMQGSYDRLVLPSYKSDGFDKQAGHYSVTSHIQGTEFRTRWHQSKPSIAGGRGLDHGTIDLIVDLVRDLAEIPAGPLVEAGVKVATRKALQALLERRLAPLVGNGLLDDSQVNRGRALASDWVAGSWELGRLFVSNTDFRVPNLIEVEADRTALVDWDEAQASGFEQEHCIAYQWLFLWNRPDLQSALVRAARDRLGIDRDTFRIVLLTRAAAQAQIYSAMPDLRRVQVKYVTDVMDESTFARIWS